ncbi:Uncharacterised protein [Citrobacter freundii]|nr:Uncharacterised protein [Citrobacter freundii]
MSGELINYQGNIFILDVLANAIHCPVFSCWSSHVDVNSKVPLLSLPFSLSLPHRSLPFPSVLFFLVVINFIFNHFHSKYIERY